MRVFEFAVRSERHYIKCIVEILKKTDARARVFKQRNNAPPHFAFEKRVKIAEKKRITLAASARRVDERLNESDGLNARRYERLVCEIVELRDEERRRLVCGEAEENCASKMRRSKCAASIRVVRRA